MFDLRRIAGAAFCLASAVLLLVVAGRISGDLASAAPQTLALSVLASSTGLLLLGIGSALATARAPLSESLGLSAGRLGILRVSVLVIGAIGISHLLDFGLRVSEVRQATLLPVIDRAAANATGRSLWLLVAAFGIAPGIAEEVLFRGWLLRALRPGWGATFAIVVSGCLFGALHYDVPHVVTAAGLGFYLGVVAVATSSTRSAIACHVCNNLAALAFATGALRVSIPLWPRLSLAVVAAAAGVAVAVHALRSQGAARAHSAKSSFGHEPGASEHVSEGRRDGTELGLEPAPEPAEMSDDTSPPHPGPR